MRVLARWIGKHGMIKAATEYVRDPANARVRRAATEDKSWSAGGIDTDAMIELVKASDRRVGTMLQLMKAYGLRRREAVMFKPHQADQLDGVAIRVRDGTKGGRERIVMIETEEQKRALADAKKIALTVNAHIEHPDHSLKQAINHFNYIMGKFGVTRNGLGITSHGLRHQALNDKYQRITGVPSPVRGGQRGEGDEFRNKLAKLHVAEMAGHSRESISTAYLGSLLSVKKKQTQSGHSNEQREPEHHSGQMKNLMTELDGILKTLNQTDGDASCESSPKTNPDSPTAH